MPHARARCLGRRRATLVLGPQKQRHPPSRGTRCLGRRRAAQLLRCSDVGLEATARGFEPLRAEPNGFLVHHLGHSVTLSLQTSGTTERSCWRLASCGDGPDICEQHGALCVALGPQKQRRPHRRCASLVLGAAEAKASPEAGARGALAGDAPHSCCAAAVLSWTRQRRDSNPCGQSPMDF